MKIIEALKELPLLEKRIEKNIELIQKYSSEVEGAGEFTFKTKEQQTAEVASLIQSVSDLAARRGKIRRALAMTNATVTVAIQGVTRTITEWIEYRERGYNFEARALQALNTNTAASIVRTTQVQVDIGIKPVRFYDEAEKNAKLAAITEIHGAIDATLEIINATTELTEGV